MESPEGVQEAEGGKVEELLLVVSRWKKAGDETHTASRLNLIMGTH